jgi:hypothetical protein
MIKIKHHLKPLKTIAPTIKHNTPKAIQSQTVDLDVCIPGLFNGGGCSEAFCGVFGLFV